MKTLSFRIVVAAHDDPDLSFLEQDYADCGAADAETYKARDRERLAAFRAGDWCMTGIWAEVELEVCGVIQKIRSGGLWGIESDCGDDHRREVAKDEYDQLAEIAAAMGAAGVLPPLDTAQWVER